MSRTYKKGDVLRTYAEVQHYMEWRDKPKVAGEPIRFIAVEIRSWFNPFRLIYGKFYYRIV